MAREARSQFAVLAMLTLRPMTGYDLRRDIESSIGHFWQESFGQLYPTLANLEAEGLASSKVDDAGDRARQVYSITKKGRAKLRAWLSKTPARHVERNELLLKLFFASEVEAAVPIAHLRDSRADAAARLATLHAVGPSLSDTLGGTPGYDYYWATLRNGELGLEAHIRWCDEVLARLEARMARRDA